ncbi:hypothetical protein I0C86_17920 [Plantactinospora sp. S1510]|uniref:Uncharacterized protein n=1 Tax=Plantactinospora alkalitolerans TaxID=2789879 RepID=A0ABS0GXW5_9ACTN|nr:hypothetical protein [Plantactinospora alkalitolerans]MBF9130823.1 hypothetical protein [Plantactinospora alkalitolerans]
MRRLCPDDPNALLVLRHRRNWRRLWLHCRCGLWWSSCPDRGRSVLRHRVLPKPDLPARSATPVAPPPPNRPRSRNTNPRWNAPTTTGSRFPTLGQRQRVPLGTARRR